MIKKTLSFSSPVYLSKKNEQLLITYPKEKNDSIQEPEPKDKYLDRSNLNTIPIEDIGVVVLDERQITITQALLSSLIENNTAVITTGANHIPNGMFLPLESNLLQSERFRSQISASEPLKKKLWQQTVSSKILNQALLLNKLAKKSDNMKRWAKTVKSGDSENLEGRAAAYYWKTIFPDKLSFNRDRFGEPPNNLLNYGYAILRAVVARGLVSSGLLPTLGIHHHNKYNAYCLADDIMEPYRPYVDEVVVNLINDGIDFTELTPEIKKVFLTIPALTINIDGENSPLMVGMQRTTSSLEKCFSGEQRKIIYPVFA